jgi:hypothetical protein
MHIVLMTSMLRPVRDHTVFSTNQRKEQTLHTIKTAREKIPGCFIVMVEGGYMEESEEILFKGLVDYLFRTDVTQFPKSPGEATLLHRYLTSDHFKSLNNVETVSKLSGRYYLNDNFNWNALPTDKSIIALIPVAWMGKPLYKTRYYRIPQKHLNNFILGLQRYLGSKECRDAWPDIEHCFHLHNIIVHDEVYAPEPLGVCGLITGTNEFVID